MTSRTNLSLGRTLSRRLRGAGLTDVAAVTFTVGGPAARHMQRTLVTRARPALIAAGSATAEEIDQHLADLNCASLDIAVFPIVSAWGHKPDEGQDRRDTSRSTTALTSTRAGRA